MTNAEQVIVTRNVFGKHPTLTSQPEIFFHKVIQVYVTITETIYRCRCELSFYLFDKLNLALYDSLLNASFNF